MRVLASARLLPGSALRVTASRASGNAPPPPPPPPSGLPAWLSSAAVFEWVQVPSGNIATAGVTPSPLPPGGVRYVVDAWCGAAVRQSTAHYILHGGGHGDYAGNEVYAIQLSAAAPTWARIWGPTPNGQITTGTHEYADGNPASAHTYYMLQYDDVADRLMRIGGGVYLEPPGTTNRVHSWNWGATNWNLPSTHPPLPDVNGAGAGTARHPVSGDIYVWDRSTLMRWNRSSNTWTEITIFASVQRAENAMVVDPDRGCIWSFGGEGAASGFVDRWLLADNTLSQVAVSGNSSASTTGVAMGAARDPETGHIYLYAGDGVLRRFSPSDNTLTTVSTTGGAPGTNASYGNTSGTYNRLQYITALKALAVKPAWDSPLFCIRVA